MSASTVRPAWCALAIAGLALVACADAPPPPARAEPARAEPARAEPARAAASPAVPRDSTWVEVTGPTLIAFYPPSAATVIDAGDDAATALDDFGYHLASAIDSLRALGVRVESVGSRVLHVVQGGRTTVFTVPRDSADIGYYLVAPGQAPVVYHGVLADADLIDAAQRYLHAARPRP